jgi:peptidoglycan hydrolase-like protein with peptidoglycan-binding domain
MDPIFRPGSRGPTVRLLQSSLNFMDNPTRGTSFFRQCVYGDGAFRPFGAPLTVDGDFGPLTMGALAEFQRYRGLYLDPPGVFGPSTLDALFPCYLITFKPTPLDAPSFQPRVVQYRPIEPPAPSGPYLPPLKKPDILKKPGDDDDDARWQFQLGYGSDGTSLAVQYLATKVFGFDWSIGAEGDFTFRDTGSKAQVYINIQKTSLFKLRFSDQFKATFDVFAQPYRQFPLGKANDDSQPAVGVDFGVQGNVDLKPALRRWLGINVPLSVYGQLKAGPQRKLETRETNLNLGYSGGLTLSF